MFRSKQPIRGTQTRDNFLYIRLPAHMITPPALSIRFLSSLLFGLWSSDSAIAVPALETIVLESPTFATYKWFPTNTAADAVEPSSL
jgi:hypothetical protein